MKNLADIRHSMRAVSDTRQITSAMRLISISKMQKALARYEANKLHFDRVQSAMKDILTHTHEVHHSFLEHQDEGMPAYIVIAGDKGLCGGYNHNILNYALEVMGEKPDKMVLTVGQEARVFFQRQKVNIDIEYMHIAQDPSLYSARKLADELTDLYIHSSINEVHILYTHFISTFKQVPSRIQLLPLQLENFQDVELETEYSAEIEYIPSPEQVLATLVPQYINGLVYGALVQSYASEHCARMLAMEGATKSADEMLASLDLELNQARQYAITAEISEIVGAMDALE